MCEAGLLLKKLSAKVMLLLTVIRNGSLHIEALSLAIFLMCH